MRILFFSLYISFSFLNVNAQNAFLDSITIPKNNTALFLRTYYYDYIDEDGKSTRKDIENNIDLRSHYFTDNSKLIDSISNLWSTDSSNFLGCFCGYDFEIFLYTGDSLIKKMKYVFCCDDFVINKKHLYLDKDKMTQSIRLMIPIDYTKFKDYINVEWIEK